MILTRKQEEGLRCALERYKNGERFTIISGYAGTGKSTLVKFLVEALSTCGIDPQKDICYTAFTGKACQVLQSKGHQNVSTLHKLLYVHIPLPNGKYLRKPAGNIPYKIVVVDEISMAPAELMKELFSYPVHIIGLGDPFQLPPINPKDDNHLLDTPHVFLDEVMRQAADSEIITLSMKIRNYEDFKATDFAGQEVKIFPREALSTGMLQWADQNICATNATRIDINNTMREMLGRGDLPETGDKVICLRNYWETLSEEGNPLINGSIGYLQNPRSQGIWIPAKISASGKSFTLNSIVSDIQLDTNEIFYQVNCDKKLILTGEKSLDWKTEYKMNRIKDFADKVPFEFTYGYAITYWKAQGSEWEKVLIIEEKFPYDKLTHARAMYTAVTRASKQLVYITN